MSREFNSKYLDFWWGNSFDLSFERCGYFDNRPRINISLFFFTLKLILPFQNEWTDECDSPKWGIAVHNNTLWIYLGGKGNMDGNNWWTWDIPFFTKKWYRASILLKDNTWAHETPKDKKDFYKTKWKNRQKVWDYSYLDKFDGSVIPTRIYVEEREWRRKWLGWTKMFSVVKKSIDIHFTEQCGKGKEEWKGGVLGCGYDMQPNEDPIDCIERMIVERPI